MEPAQGRQPPEFTVQQYTRDFSCDMKHSTPTVFAHDQVPA